MRNLLIVFAASVAFAAGGPSFAQTDTINSGTQVVDKAHSPGEFASIAAQSNMFEIQSSKLVLDKSKQDDVRSFARQMIDDHQKAGDAMKLAAQKASVSDLPAKLNAEYQAKMETLQNASGDALDEMYWQMQVREHRQAVQLFTEFSRNKGPLADFAKKTLPTLQAHLDKAIKLSGE
jgi:putative membrane protein